MAFNSNTYHGNKARRTAWAELAQARDIKSRAARGEAYDWEIPRITKHISYARSYMRSYLHHCFMADLKRKR